jgi:hypothetical protein
MDEEGRRDLCYFLNKAIDKSMKEEMGHPLDDLDCNIVSLSYRHAIDDAGTPKLVLTSYADCSHLDIDDVQKLVRLSQATHEWMTSVSGGRTYDIKINDLKAVNGSDRPDAVEIGDVSCSVWRPAPGVCRYQTYCHGFVPGADMVAYLRQVCTAIEKDMDAGGGS